MPITFGIICSKDDWAGSSWTITNDDKLAELVAKVALGQSRYVRRVLKETGFAAQDAKETELAGALKRLTSTDPKKPRHRDGWMFQVISWIAAHLQDPNGLIAPPHMIHAHKGFDGIHVKLGCGVARIEGQRLLRQHPLPPALKRGRICPLRGGLISV